MSPWHPDEDAQLTPRLFKKDLFVSVSECLPSVLLARTKCPTVRVAIRRMALQGFVTTCSTDPCFRYCRSFVRPRKQGLIDRLYLSGKSISEMGHGLNDLRGLRRAFELLTQTRDMHVHGACYGSRLEVPHA